jgi:heme-degrading monooxygenase HmoA
MRGRKGDRMISRIWHGWTTRANADKYEKLLRGDFLPGIHRIRGYTGAYLIRRDAPNDEVEFVTITQFTDIDAVKHFAGEDYERAVIAPGAEKLLTHYDKRSASYEVLLTPSDVRAMAARMSGRNRTV